MSFRQRLVQQFKQPSGLLGSVAGFIMSRRASNVERNHWLLELLDLQPNNHVLEIGFGPGVAIEGAAKIVTNGKIIGIDHSDVMLRQATQRNARSISQGRVQLMRASVDALPAFETKFDHIFSANVVQFWPDPVKVFSDLKIHLTENGQIATLFMPRSQNATSADAHAMGKQLEQWLQQAGYSRIRTEVRDFDGLATICVIAKK